MNMLVDPLVDIAQRLAAPLLRISLGVVLFWIGALKFVHDPSPMVGLLAASLPFLAFPAFVYLLGVFEVSAALLLFACIGVRYVGLLCVALFVGTLTIFVIAPPGTYGDQGFPFLGLFGEFLLKDLVLAAASIAVTAMYSEARGSTVATPQPPIETT